MKKYQNVRQTSQQKVNLQKEKEHAIKLLLIYALFSHILDVQGNNK